ncbi:endogenous retrovirus group K member 11 Pol protein-like [Podarcis lilfordi]|uniref:Endogenous retrovirus group K member 11 Pol protein-like n=1 Tax=Podarcis lilfordi TaxID=74358 RepID=A0AA35LN65_9SAUR|nr:endogenous retrovirus group K member 11 Pol protein-like [Podarcis lilfordi]
MDVTHTPLLAPFSKVHLTVDTSSGFIWATPLKGETARHVIQHILRCFAVMGQAIVERAHLTFKTLLSKQLGGNIHRLRFIFEKQSLWLGLLCLTDSYLIQHGMVLCHSSPGDAATRQWTWMDGLPGYQRAVCDPGELLPRK